MSHTLRPDARRPFRPPYSPGVTLIVPAALYPLAFDAATLTAGTSRYHLNPAVRLLVDFFHTKGLATLKEEDRQEDWYQDWIAYQATNGIYASLLSPQRYSSRGHRFDLWQLTRFLEIFTYYSPAHAYSLHVSFLGLFPILLSDNESLKKEAVALLESGGLFAFAVSEKAHGSDLLANEFTLRPVASGGYVADGSKYYIGNANAAGMISIMAKQGGGKSAGTPKRSPPIFFALRPASASGLGKVRKIRTLGIRTAFVGEFSVCAQPVPAGDVLAQGRDAWNAIFGTIDFGKFFLGFGAIGICEHAFAEAAAHMQQRLLYGKLVTELLHIRATVAVSFARLVAMKLYAYRALCYLQVASPDDRRYLLFNAVQKAKVSTEGVKVMGLLSECIGARGFEAETFFELALRDAQLIPGLEGSTHINFGQTAQFIDAYFADPASTALQPMSPPGETSASVENPYWFESHDRNPRTVVFAAWNTAYLPLRAVPNVRAFMRQVEAFRLFVASGVSALHPSLDVGLVLGVGKCFSTIAYAQLVAENCIAVQMETATVSVIFHGLIEDLSAEALKLSAMFAPRSEKRVRLKKVVRVPETIVDDLETVAAFVSATAGSPPPQVR